MANLGEYYRGPAEANDPALQLQPDFVATFVSRSNAQCLLGLISESIDDRMEVETFQNIFKTLGYYKGAIDGDFGPAAKRALRNHKRGTARDAISVLELREWSLTAYPWRFLSDFGAP